VGCSPRIKLADSVKVRAFKPIGCHAMTRAAHTTHPTHAALGSWRDVSDVNVGCSAEVAVVIKLKSVHCDLLRSYLVKAIRHPCVYAVQSIPCPTRRSM
jgi:hypothetical protein